MQGCFAFRFAISHETARFNGRSGDTIGIGALSEKHFEHKIMSQPIGSTQSRVKRSLTSIGQRLIHVGTLLDQKLTQPPVSVKRRSVEIKVVPQRLD